jgi:hypothetical protein
MKKMFSRWVVMVGLVLGLLSGCTPAQLKSPEFPFKSGAVWILEGTNATTKATFSYDLVVEKAVSDYPYTIGIVIIRSDSYSGEITFSDPEKDGYVAVEMKPESTTKTGIICWLNQNDKFQKRYFGYSFFGLDLRELNEARRKNDSNKLGLCSLYPK